MADERTIVQELYNRRATLSPDQQGIVAELAKRHGLTGEIPNKADAEPDSAHRGFGSSLWQYTGEPIANLLHAAHSLASGEQGTGKQLAWPLVLAFEAGKGALSESGKFVAKTGEALGKGDIMQAIHDAPGMVPVAGPIAEDMSDKVAAGNYGGAAGAALGLAGPALLTKALPRTIGPIVKNKNNPTVDAAMQDLKANGVPMDVGQETGNRMLQRVGRNLENYYGSSDRAHEFYTAQEQALADRGQVLAESARPGYQTNAVGAGQGVQQRLTQRVNILKNRADQLYGQVRNATAANKQSVQVGTKNSGVLDANGQPITTPIMNVFETPVDLAPVRQQLTPIYEDLQRAMPEARRQASPAFAALKSLMESAQSQMSAMDFDRSLSAVKSLVRDGDNPLLSSQSQGIAKKFVKAGEQQLDQALATAGPNVKSTLTSGRKAVRSYHDTAELLADLNDEPAALYQNLTTGGDRVYNTLQSLQKVAPDQLKTVGRTFLEGLMQKATAEGGFKRSSGVLADWQKIGPESREIMFGKRLSGELDNFFLGAKKLGETGEGSRTAPVQTAIKHFINPWLSAPVETGVGAIAGHPAAGLATAAAHVLASDTIPRFTAKLLMTPGGSRLLTRTMTTGVGTPEWTDAMRVINTRLGAVKTEEEGQR